MEHLKRQIRQLNPEQLSELRTYINNWRPTEKPSEKSSWIVDAFEVECKRLMLGFVQPAAKDIVRAHAPELEDFFNKACPEKGVVTKRVVLATGLDLLYKNLRGMDVTVNPKVLAN